MINKEEMEKIVSSSETFQAILRHFGFSHKGGNSRTLKCRLIKDKIDFSHISSGFSHNRWKTFPNKAKPLEEYLTENSTYARFHLKKRLLEQGILENKCSICGLNSEWKQKPLVMILDHINGISNDNRLENLRMICPNCNSQQPTFAGRLLRKIYHCSTCGKEIRKNAKMCRKCNGANNRKVKNRPLKEDLEKMIWEKPTSKVAKQFNVSDQAITKWCKSYGIPKPGRGYWTKLKS